MISGQYGIGYYTWEAYTLQKYPNIVLGMISIGVLGMGSSLLIKWTGRALHAVVQTRNGGSMNTLDTRHAPKDLGAHRARAASTSTSAKARRPCRR